MAAEGRVEHQKLTKQRRSHLQVEFLVFNSTHKKKTSPLSWDLPENQKLNQTAALLSLGRVFGFQLDSLEKNLTTLLGFTFTFK